MNVLYVDIDSLRADHVGVYGAPFPATPKLDELAEDGVWFERAYVANSPCMPSRAGLISGRYGIHNGVSTHGGSAQLIDSPQTRNEWFAGWAEDWRGETRNALSEKTGDSSRWLTLPEVFFHERVRTMAISSFPRHTAPFFYHLWHEFHQPQEPVGPDEYFQTPRAEDIANLAIELIEANAGREFFLYVQFWDPHTPYNRTDAEVERFRGSPLPPFPTTEQLLAHREWDWSSAEHVGLQDRDDLQGLLAKYRAEIRYVDEHVGRILDALRAAEIFEDTCVVVTADHGEEFGEHGMYRQHWSTYDGTQRVPMIMSPPAGTAIDRGGRHQLVTNVDMAPTIVDYAGLEPPGAWQGTSVRPIVGEASTPGRESVVLEHGLYTVQRALRTTRWKLIETYHPGLWQEVLPERQLFDLEEDPWEQENLANSRPEVLEDLGEKMDAWVERRKGDYGDPLVGVAERGPPGALAGESYWRRDISRDTTGNR